jgi:hypothetical protein
MTGIRRAVVLVGLTLAVTIGPAIHASAGFAGSATVTTGISTGTVAAPASVTVNDYCQGYWYTITASWPASATTRGVTGYRVTAYLNDGTSYVMAQTDALTRSTTSSVDQYYLTRQPRIAVATLTSYGWTAETPRTAVLAC